MPGEPARWSQEELDAHMARMRGDSQPPPPLREKKARNILPAARKMNATEAAYAAILEQRKRLGDVLDYKHEGMTLLLANDTRYTPDFVVRVNPISVSGGQMIRFVEVKREWKPKRGRKPANRPHIEDDARVKLAVAAEQFKHFATLWLAWLDASGEWHEEPVNV